MIIDSLTDICKLLKKGNVIAYPTEAVFGLGCDPNFENAVLDILNLKKRSIDKGLILIADELDKFADYIDLTQLTLAQRQKITESVNDVITWIVPKNKNAPYYLTGQFDSIAIRITAHPLIRELCHLYGKAIVSTSANLSGLAPCRSVNDVINQFNNAVPILNGSTLNKKSPSKIKDIKTDKTIRS